MSAFPVIYWLAAVVSASQLVIAWLSGDLRSPRGIVLAAWFATALAVQWLTPEMSTRWAVALVLQTGLAIYLVVRSRLGS